MKPSSFFLFSALAFCACTSSQPPEKHSFRCYVRYLEDQNQLRAEALLYSQDSTMVYPEGGIRYDDQKMDSLAVKNGGYRYQHTGAATELAVFDWLGAKGKKHEFTLPLLPVSDFGFGPGAIPRNRPDTLHWSGAPLTRGETLVLMWESLDNGPTIPMEIYGTNPQQEIVFPAAQMAKVPAGRWSLYLVRRKLVKGEAGDLAASGVSEYYTRADTVVVK